VEVGEIADSGTTDTGSGITTDVNSPITSEDEDGENDDKNEN